MQHEPFLSDMADAGRMVQFCPMCDAEFNPLLARILGEYPSGTVMHIVCRNCRHAILAIMAQTAGGMSSFGFITDASADDYIRLQGSAPITADDVIDMHVHLERGVAFASEITK